MLPGAQARETVEERVLFFSFFCKKLFFLESLITVFHKQLSRTRLLLLFFLSRSKKTIRASSRPASAAAAAGSSSRSSGGSGARGSRLAGRARARGGGRNLCGSPSSAASMPAPLALALRRLLVSSPHRRVAVTVLASHEQQRALARSGARALAIGDRGSLFFSTAIADARRSIAVAASAGKQRPEREAPSFIVPEDAPEKILGQVMSAQANFVRVRVDSVDGEESLSMPPAPSTSTSLTSAPTSSPFPRPELLCTVRALLKKMRQSVLVGDRVAVSGIDWASGRGAVDSVLLPRSSILTDPPVANADHVLVVLAAASPPLEPRNASKFLVAAEAAGLPVSVALNKADLVPEEELLRSAEMLRSWGYDVFPTTASRERGDDDDDDGASASSSSSSSSSFGGVSSLLPALRGRVTVLAGPSGVGKSSLINALLQRNKEEEEEEARGDGEARSCDGSVGSDGDEASPSPSSLLAVGEVSRAGRGRHTTRHVCLVPLPMPAAVGTEGSGGGSGPDPAAAVALLADTPGFNQPDLASLGVRPAELAALFPEVRERLGRCAFADCAHVSEPGCALRDGIDSENEGEGSGSEDEGKEGEGGDGNGEGGGGGGDDSRVSSSSPLSTSQLWQRHPWYVETLFELREAAQSTKARQAEKAARQGAVRMKSSKRGGGGSGSGSGAGERTGVSSTSTPNMRAEALLNPKKDRRVSRGARKKGLADLLEEEGL